MADAAEVMEEVFAVLCEVQHRTFEAVVKAARRVRLSHVVFPDNVTAPVIGPTYFRRFCVSAYDELADMLADAGLDVKVFSHTDGGLKPLWAAIGDSKLAGLDSLSPPPDNDTSVGAAAEMWPQMRLWVNFPSSVHLARPDVIYETARAILDQAGQTGRLQIQISENVPPGRWKVSYPQIVRAIADIARIMGKETIAEFVGDEQTRQLIREIGIDYAQGYLIGAPAAEIGSAVSASEADATEGGANVVSISERRQNA